MPGRITLVLESHGTANLIYQLDCMAEMLQCSASSYVELWQSLGWSEDDRKALAEWKRLRGRFRGELTATDTARVQLPVLGSDRSSDLDSRQRWAGFEARSVKDYARLIELLTDVGDADRLASLLAHFEPRFARWWRDVGAPATLPFVDASATLVATPAVTRVIDAAVRFYQADVPHGMRVPIHFFYRPALGGNRTSAEMVEARAAVEIMAGEKPEERMGVVLHEIFHVFYARMLPAAQSRMTIAFAERAEPHALAAHALYNEALATALGNGVVDALLQPAANARARQKPLALYNDAAIDAAARSLLSQSVGPSIDQLLFTATIDDPSFVSRYVQGAASAFPHGLRPIDTLLRFAAASSAELREARIELQRASGTHSAYTFTPIDAEVSTMMHDAPRQTVALFVTPSTLGLLDGLLPPASLKRVRRTAASQPSFVDSTKRGNGTYTYVFVAKDAPAAKRLVTGFAALTATAEGVLPL